MTKEPAWLPAQLTFGPGFMLMGSFMAARSAGGRDWVAFGIAVLGTLMLSRGLISLLKVTRDRSAEIERLRQQLGTRPAGE